MAGRRSTFIALVWWRVVLVFFVVGGEGRKGRHVFRICLEVGIL